MFERRIKVFLLFLILVAIVLISRAMVVQVVQHKKWVEAADSSNVHEKLTETTRGQLLDVKGRPIAMDVPSIDACVDYPVITDEPDKKYVHDAAVARIKARNGLNARIPRAELADEIQQVKADIAEMWRVLAQEGGLSVDEMNDQRHRLVRSVELRRRYLWYYKHQQDDLAAARAAAADDADTAKPTTRASTQPVHLPPPTPAVQAWLNGETNDAPSNDFDITISEQTEAHKVLTKLNSDAYNRLSKRLENFPGLSLRSSMERTYPFAEIGCHVVGHLAHVETKDLASDLNAEDELRKYQLNDQIGRAGLESLCEPLLRGTRGRVTTVSDDTGTHDNEETAKAGKDVKTTLDMDLEKDIVDAFSAVPVQRLKADPVENIPLHGAAVVLDVATNEVRAIVSTPTFDINQYNELYSTLRADVLNQPLLNLATEAQLETGSTIKPVVGIGAITEGKVGLNEGVECTGYLIIGNKRFAKQGRCWVASNFEGKIPSVSHHPIPVPHKGHDGNPDGFLTFSDALERSCNVYFENMGDRLGLEGLSHWMDLFGLGRSTGIGIAEATGRLPDSIPKNKSSEEHDWARWYGGIGQDYVAANPLQMADVAATIARSGVWMRPHLVPAGTMHELEGMITPSEARWTRIPERVELPISAQAVAAAQDGMKRVANGEAGTGLLSRDDGLVAAGKTGTAQAAHFVIPTLDENNKPVLDDKGALVRRALEPSTHQNPNPLAPWYLGFGEKGDEVKHSWYIGYAPADHPQVAFAVLVEYGGSGGGAAKFIVNKILDSCIRDGYITGNKVAAANE